MRRFMPGFLAGGGRVVLLHTVRRPGSIVNCAVRRAAHEVRMAKSGGTNRLFVDQVTIFVRGGRGGDGCVSFRREKYVPRGGPDGGDGGNGGSVYLEGRSELNTLLDLSGRHHWYGENGRPGEGGNRTGRRGQDLVVPVPVGTLVYDADSGRLLKDVVAHGERVRVARGGLGGYGNTHYVSPTHQVPREFKPGEAGQERTLRLELKLIADVGLVGLPNAGKSTLLSRLTRARPKIAPYPFTTLDPQLGILELPGFRRIVLADIPGLIEGAHEGVGLGDAFLRHIERTRVIVHMVDLCPAEGAPTPLEAYRIIRHELEKYSTTLAEREEVVVGNKLDLTGADEALEELRAALGVPVYGLSGVTGAGLREMGEVLWTAVSAVREEAHDSGPVRLDLGNVFDEEEDEPDADAEEPSEARAAADDAWLDDIDDDTGDEDDARPGM
jgi:GTP-binding protein